MLGSFLCHTWSHLTHNTSKQLYQIFLLSHYQYIRRYLQCCCNNRFGFTLSAFVNCM